MTAHSDILASVQKHVDDDASIHAVIPVGGNDALDYYLVVFEEPHSDHDDATLLKERYYQVPTEGFTDEYSETFLKNGISRRRVDGDGLADRLARAYRVTAHRDLTTDDDPAWLARDDD